MTDAAPLLEVRNLTIRFAAEGRPAVDGVSFSVGAGETLAVVGESGSGKSVTAMAMTRLLPEPPARYAGGEILLEGRNLLALPERELRGVRGGQIAYVFQDPMTSLNPVLTVRRQMAEVLALHRPDVGRARKAQDAEIVRALTEVGITEPEPTTALDATVQRQIMDLFRELKGRSGMSILLITHNFGIIGGLADRVAVMFRGRLVEEGRTEDVLERPQHPYTRALIDCIPKLGANRHRLATIDHAALEGSVARCYPAR